jgi:hypothetical protein
VTKNILDEYVTSYLNIDAYIEDQRVRYYIYSNNKYLFEYFKSLLYEVEFTEHYSTISIGEEKSKSYQRLDQVFPMLEANSP